MIQWTNLAKMSFKCYMIVQCSIKLLKLEFKYRSTYMKMTLGLP